MLNRHSISTRACLAAVSVCVLTISGCFAEPEPVQITPRDAGVADSDLPDVTTRPACLPAQSEEPVPARTKVLSAQPNVGGELVYVSELFARFRNACGGCHYDGSQGDFQVQFSSFGTEETV